MSEVEWYLIFDRIFNMVRVINEIVLFRDVLIVYRKNEMFCIMIEGSI